jgi:hypothetical protein
VAMAWRKRKKGDASVDWIVVFMSVPVKGSVRC